MDSLFKISTDIHELLWEIQEAVDETGEVPEELQELLIIKDEELQTKSVNIVHYIKYVEGQKEMIKKEQERISKLNKALASQEDRLKAVLLQAVLLFGHQKKATAAQKAKGREGNKSLEVVKDTTKFILSDKYGEELVIDEDHEIPSRYQRVSLNKINKKDHEDLLETLRNSTDLSANDIQRYIDLLEPKDVEFNKVEIKKALKESEDLTGATLATTRSLSIK